MSYFTKQIVPKKENENSPLFLVSDKFDVLIKTESEETAVFLNQQELYMLTDKIESTIYIGDYNNAPCYSVSLKDKNLIPPNFEFRYIRKLYNEIGHELFFLCGYAIQILNWEIKTKYCTNCKSKLISSEIERMKKCEECSEVFYPKISPAVIVAVIKDDEILLARSPRFPEDMHSVLAGFVEVSESLEETVKREVYEESNIIVKNIKYFGSQPWPFPDSLMIGFTAEYESGELKIDGEEIVSAGWYKYNNLPLIPQKPSIAGELIQWFIRKQKRKIK